MNHQIREIDFVEQISSDQLQYSRYVCDSRAIPNAIDGLKPVQRRILWTMWNSSAKENFTKTVKVAGMTMAYHPHGNTSIEDAISQMVQQFTFANNYALISGEGMFGDILDPKAIASARYTEVKISDFAKDVGLFDSLADLDYTANYDETQKEPFFLVPKIPLVLINSTLGIATGFRCNILGHNLSEVIDATILHLRKKKIPLLKPWYRGYKGESTYLVNQERGRTFTTRFYFTQKGKQIFLTQTPQGWNREKTVRYLESIIKDREEIKDYLDHSKDQFKIELVVKRGYQTNLNKIKKIFDKVNVETVDQHVITQEGKLKNQSDEAIIKNFCIFRRTHLIRRFTRLAKMEQEKINKLDEMIRFIKEKWNEKTLLLKNKQHLIQQLEKNRFVFTEWLAGIPIYRMTLEEVAKSKKLITESKNQLSYYQRLTTQENSLTRFMIKEMEALKKWDQQ